MVDQEVLGRLHVAWIDVALVLDLVFLTKAVQSAESSEPVFRPPPTFATRVDSLGIFSAYSL